MALALGFLAPHLEVARFGRGSRAPPLSRPFRGWEAAAASYVSSALLELLLPAPSGRLGAPAIWRTCIKGQLC